MLKYLNMKPHVVIKLLAAKAEKSHTCCLGGGLAVVDF